MVGLLLHLCCLTTHDSTSAFLNHTGTFFREGMVGNGTLEPLTPKVKKNVHIGFLKWARKVEAEESSWNHPTVVSRGQRVGNHCLRAVDFE